MPEIILFDTEYTAWEGSQARRWSAPGEHREIIQIAALRVDPARGFAETGRFQRLARPARNPQLSEYIRALTGLRQADIDARGIPFGEAYAAFAAFCAPGSPALFSWGDDPGVLRENCALAAIPEALFPGGFYDVRDPFAEAGIDTRGYTSGSVYRALNLPHDLAAHDALNDVTSLRVTLAELARRGQFGPRWRSVFQGAE